MHHHPTVSTPRALALASALALALAPCPRAADAAEYRSPRGYSLRYPDGWCVATGHDHRPVGEAAARLLSATDFKMLDAMFYDPNSDPLTNINVIVDRRIRVSPEILPRIEDALRQRFAASGLQAEDLRCRIIRAADRDAIEATWSIRAPLPDTHPVQHAGMRQRQMVLSGRTHSYTVTCTAAAGRFPEIEPLFNGILESLRIDEEPAAPGPFGLPAWVIPAIGGAAIALVLLPLALRRRRRDDPPATP